MNPEPAVTADLLTHAVARPHLLAQLDAGGRGPLTVVVAPPGYGKSVLLAQWADSLRGPHIWLRLDQQDREIPRLGSGLTAGTTVVMDDFDFVSRSARHEAWNAVMKLCQQGLHVVIGSRTRPELTASRLAATGDVTVLGARDLALRIDEARELLEVVSGRDLSDPQVSELHGRTEGWAAGLQLAAMALRDHEDVDGFVDAFAGDDRYVAMYLTDQVLAAQPSAIRRFLLRTSILDRLNGWVCNAVTGDEDGHQMLELLEHQSMFINRLDGPVTSFRYHRLFQEFLRHQRSVDEPENERVLLRRAAHWHAEHDDVDAAAAYLMRARDWEPLLDLVALHGRSMFERGRASTVLHWLDAVPAETRASRREVALEESALQTMLGNTLAAEEALSRFTATGSSNGERVVAGAIRATWGEHHASAASVIAAADDALSEMEFVSAQDIPDVLGLTSPSSVRVLAAGGRARAQWYLGEDANAEAGLRNIIGEAAAYKPWFVNMVGTLALVEAWSGQLRLAEAHAQQALTAAGDDSLQFHPAIISAQLAIAHVLIERNQPRRAELVLHEARWAAARNRRSVALALCAVEQARVHQAELQPFLGLTVLAAFRSSGYAMPPPAIAARLRAVEARLLMATDDRSKAARVLARGKSDRYEVASAAVELATTSRDAGAARQTLAAWPDRDGQLGARLAWSVSSALLSDLEGNRRGALAHMSRALELGRPEGHVRVFLDGGERAARLLRALAHSNPTPYLARLADRGRPKSTAAATVAGNLDDRLSDRELDVLRYLPSRMANAEIAANMYVSLNTVKSHLGSIYRKLGVTGRGEAIAQAEKLNLI